MDFAIEEQKMICHAITWSLRQPIYKVQAPCFSEPEVASLNSLMAILGALISKELTCSILNEGAESDSWLGVLKSSALSLRSTKSRLNALMMKCIRAQLTA